VTRSEKITKAKELGANGLNNREIADELAISPSCVWKWRNPERTKEWNLRDAHDPKRKAKKRAWDREHRRRCQDCEGLMGIGSRRRSTRCHTCHELREAARVDRRARKIEKWWADGKDLPWIAKSLGWSRGHIGVEFHRLREKGYDLPYRYEHWKNEPVFPEQEAV